MPMILAEVCEKCGQQTGFNWPQAVVMLGFIVVLIVIARKI
jgi:hypothetical protein